ncbi:MAG: hypothetical protein N2314_03655 [Brevinematales bacterium]|nr:hypothetical protein [Brevinematales bacterium]
MGMVVELVEAKHQLYQLLSEGKLDEVQQRALELMSVYPQDRDLEEILATVRFWMHRQEYFLLQDDATGGEELFQEWWKYEHFRQENHYTSLKVYQAMRYFVFSRLVDILVELYQLSPVPRRDVLVMLGEVFLTLGMVERAIETLEYALSLGKSEEDVSLYVLLGNAYVEAGQEDMASVMYNDALYVNPPMVEIEKISYPPLQKLIELIASHGVKRELIGEWLAVYAFVHGALKHKRELSSRAHYELKQRILMLEQTIKYDKKALDVLLPRLINSYLWLLDYYLYQAKAKNNARALATKIVQVVDKGVTVPQVRDHLLERFVQVFAQMEKILAR